MKGTPTGLWVEEFAAPYYMFQEKGFDIVVASSSGGPIPIDTGSMSEPYFTGSKRIHPIKSLKAFVDEFRNQSIDVNANDYLLCGSLIQPYSIKKNDFIKIEYEGLSKFEIKIK